MQHILHLVIYRSGSGWFYSGYMCVYGIVPGERWKTSNKCPLLEFTGHQPTLLCSSRQAFSLPAKCWCLKYRTPWQWLLLRVRLRGGNGLLLAITLWMEFYQWRNFWKGGWTGSYSKRLFLHNYADFCAVSSQRFPSAAENLCCSIEGL